MKINPLDFLREELDRAGSRHSLELTAFFTRGQGEKWAYTWDIKDVHDDAHPEYHPNVGVSPSFEESVTHYLDVVCESFRMGTERKVHVHFYRSKDDVSVWEHKVTLDSQSIWSKFKDKMTSVFS